MPANNRNTLLQAILFSPSYNSPVFLVLINIILLGLSAVIGSVVYFEIDTSIHSYIFFALSIGLTISINWFIVQVRYHVLPQDTEGGCDNVDETKLRAKTD